MVEGGFLTLSCKSIREYDYYFNYLIDNHQDIKEYDGSTQNIDRYNNHLVSEINYFKISQKIQSLMQSKFKEEEQVSLSQLDWLKADNGRACNWLWSRPLQLTEKLAGMISRKKTTTASNEERFKPILNSFIEGENNIEEQLDIINKCKIDWEEIYSLKVIIPWFDINNKAQEAWIWDYLQKSHHDDFYNSFKLNILE